MTIISPTSLFVRCTRRYQKAVLTIWSLVNEAAESFIHPKIMERGNTAMTIR